MDDITEAGAVVLGVSADGLSEAGITSSEEAKYNPREYA